MKVFITVGTTHFDSLIEFLDKNLNDNDDALFQIANGTYRPQYFKYIQNTEDINTLYKEYDYIITHGGSGTIYKLLSLRKKFIIVPNLERIDSHQIDIAKFLEDHSYAIYSKKFSDIIPSLRKLPTLEFNHYQKSNFIKTQEICKLIQKSLA